MLEIVPDPQIEGLTRLARDRSWPRPWVGVLAAVHGNEPCGLAALSALIDAARAGDLPLQGGTLLLLHGNPEATRLGRRYTEGGVDLNRIFDYAFVDELPAHRWTSEHHRALALRPAVEDVDALLDLHSATSPTPPFAIVNDVRSARALAQRLGFDFATVGWGRPGMRMDSVSIGLPMRKGRPGISVECGQHEAPDAPAVAVRCARRFLQATGILPGEAPIQPITFLRIEEIVARPSPTFAFVRPVRGLDRFEAGAILAADHLTELRVRKRCYVLMPNDTAAVGDDMAFLAREVPAEAVL